MFGIEGLPAQVRSALGYVLGMPVELRRNDSALLGRVTLGGVEAALQGLGPGEYVVGLTLPTGVRVFANVEVGADGRLDAAGLVRRLVSNPALGWLYEPLSSLAAEARAELPVAIGRAAEVVLPAVASGALGGLQDWLGTVVGAATRVLPGYLPPQLTTLDARGLEVVLPLKLRAFDPVSVEALPDEALRVRRAEDGRSLRVKAPDGRRRTLAQVLRPGACPLDFMLPGGATVVLSLANHGAGLSVAVETGVDIIDAMLSLSAAGRLNSVQTLLAALEPRVVASWVELTPGAAYAAVYGILRVCDRSVVGAVLEAMRDVDRDGPDVSVLEAEMAALGGRHGVALDGLARAASRGLPAFGRGLSILVDRLRFYLQAARTDDALREAGARVATTDGLREALAWAQGFAMFADFSVPVLCFTGLDVGKADDETLDDPRFEAQGGLPLALTTTAAELATRAN